MWIVFISLAIDAAYPPSQDRLRPPPRVLLKYLTVLLDSRRKHTKKITILQAELRHFVKPSSTTQITMFPGLARDAAEDLAKNILLYTLSLK
jgi:hypothetical protein